MGTTCLGIYRLAESQDIPRIIELGNKNVKNARYRRQIVYDPLALHLFVGSIMASDTARTIVYDRDGVQGVFAFTTCPNFYYFGGQLVANMVIWSVSEECRGMVSIKLLFMAKAEARKMGVKRMIMTGPDKRFGKLAKHCGFEFLESAFMVEL